MSAAPIQVPAPLPSDAQTESVVVVIDAAAEAAAKAAGIPDCLISACKGWEEDAKKEREREANTIEARLARIEKSLNWLVEAKVEASKLITVRYSVEFRADQFISDRWERAPFDSKISDLRKELELRHPEHGFTFYDSVSYVTLPDGFALNPGRHIRVQACRKDNCVIA